MSKRLADLKSSQAGANIQFYAPMQFHRQKKRVDFDFARHLLKRLSLHRHPRLLKIAAKYGAIFLGLSTSGSIQATRSYA